MMKNIDKETLAKLLKEASLAHHDFEESLGKPDENWPLWYADFVIKKLNDE